MILFQRALWTKAILILSAVVTTAQAGGQSNGEKPTFDPRGAAGEEAEASTFALASYSAAEHGSQPGASSATLSLVALQTAQTSGGDQSTAAKSGDSDEDINNKLNNPGTDLAFLNFKLTWNQFQGSLGGNGFLRNGEGPSSQNAVSLLFQPVFPFKLAGEGNNFIIRPTIPVAWAPHYNARSNGFDEEFGLADAQLVAVFAHTDKEKGYFYGFGPTMQFPTHTDNSLGRDDFRLGPAGYAGLTGKWGTVGLFAQHWWNIGGSDGYFATTSVNFFYWFSVGGGWQIGGAPIASWDWADDDSDNALTFPINLGAQKTFRFGDLPVRIRLEGQYFAASPDSFGPEWGLVMTVTPVIKNPFEK